MATVSTEIQIVNLGLGRVGEARIVSFEDGTKAADVAAAAGALAGGKLTERALLGLGAETIRRINELVGFRLLAQFGETGLLGASRLAPVAGGIAGAAVGVAATAGIAKAALALLADLPGEDAAGTGKG